MEAKKIKYCVDCHYSFQDPHDLFKKCEHCRERDECYRIRAIEDQKENENVPI